VWPREFKQCGDEFHWVIKLILQSNIQVSDLSVNEKGIGSNATLLSMAVDSLAPPDIQSLMQNLYRAFPSKFKKNTSSQSDLIERLVFLVICWHAGAAEAIETAISEFSRRPVFSHPMSVVYRIRRELHAMNQADPQSFSNQEWAMIDKCRFLLKFPLNRDFEASEIQRFLISKISLAQFDNYASRIVSTRGCMKKGIPLFRQLIKENENEVLTSQLIEEFMSKVRQDFDLYGDLQDILELFDDLIKVQYSPIM
jgi:hypothetical protein